MPVNTKPSPSVKTLVAWVRFVPSTKVGLFVSVCEEFIFSPVCNLNGIVSELVKLVAGEMSVSKLKRALKYSLLSLKTVLISVQSVESVASVSI